MIDLLAMLHPPAVPVPPALRALPLLALGAALLGAAAPALGQWQKNEQELQREAALQLAPAPLVARRWATLPAGTSPRVLRLRFYADGDYRSAGPNWQDRVRGLVAELNQLLTPAFGVRFEAEAFRRWDRRPGAGALPALLDELEAMDRGDDVDWVVGLVSALPMVSQSFHDLGVARVPGRHLLVRGASSIAELEQLRQAFPTLQQAERELLYSRRKSHKERAIFLHEWAHTLALGHTDRGTHIMSPGYSSRTSLLDEKECERIASALGKRPSPARNAGSVADPTLPRLPRPGAPGGAGRLVR
jgi:hypothetical protein